MKKILFLLILLSLSSFVHGQTKIDKFISIRIPGKVKKLDTIIKNLRIENFISQNGNETFTIQKTKLNSTSNDLNNLPSDLESLKKTYEGSITGFFNSMKETNIQFSDSLKVNIDNFECYKVIGKNGNKKAVETIFLVLNEYIYVVSYFNLVDFDENAKNIFLKSIKIDSSSNPSQTLGNSLSYKRGYLFGKLVGYLLIVTLIIFLIKKLKK